MTETKRAGGVVLVWFRLDLRLADQPALTAAVRHGGAVIPVYVWDPEGESPWAPGAATRWWLHRSLTSLAGGLREHGSRLVVRQGPALEVLQALVQETGATAVYWNRRYEPAVTTRDGRIKEALRGAGIAAESFNGSLLNEPWTVQNQGGRPFQVFTPYWRSCLATLKPNTWWRRRGVCGRRHGGRGAMPWKRWGCCRKWDGTRDSGGVAAGGSRAAEQLERFAARSILDYGAERDRPDRAGTSGCRRICISARSVRGRCGTPRGGQRSAGVSRRRSGVAGNSWRNSGGGGFACSTCCTTFRDSGTSIAVGVRAISLEDRRGAEPGVAERESGVVLWWMRECGSYGRRVGCTTGVRMVVGSLSGQEASLLSWREGAEWFWDTLVDADLASNTLGWQWVGGCGADAAPYFRIFNPVSQGRKFNPEGEYVRRWVPELQRLPVEHVHAPWEAPADVLRSAGVILGQNYPQPIVELAASRIHALAAFEKTKTV